MEEWSHGSSVGSGKKSCVHVRNLKTVSNSDLGVLYSKDYISDMLIMGRVVSWELLTTSV